MRVEQKTAWHECGWLASLIETAAMEKRSVVKVAWNREGAGARGGEAGGGGGGGRGRMAMRK